MGIRVMLLLVLAVLGPVSAQSRSVARDTVLVLENSCLRLRVSPGGGRICSLVDKHGGREVVALWKGQGEIGGLLDDR